MESALGGVFRLGRMKSASRPMLRPRFHQRDCRVATVEVLGPLSFGARDALRGLRALPFLSLLSVLCPSGDGSDRIPGEQETAESILQSAVALSPSITVHNYPTNL